MSSTGRGYDRHKSDYYVTPKEPIETFLNKFISVEEIYNTNDLLWLDPCVGGDSVCDMSYPSAIVPKFVDSMTTIDIRKDSLAEYKVNYLRAKFSHKFDIIITNPPFNIALDVIKKSLADIESFGYVIMLLRLNFFGSQERYPFFQNNMPKSCYIHHKRISFIPPHVNQQRKKDGLKPMSSDSIEYAHFVWQKDYKEDYCKAYLI